MDPEETVEAQPSADNGNVPVDAPEVAPSPDPKPEAAPVAEPAAPAEAELFELPDGRKVDAVTLTKEWKENFLPDYTRKSQALAAKETVLPEAKPTNPLADPNYVPQTYEELALQIEARTLQKLEEKQATALAERQALEDSVSSQIAELKKGDAALNENALFLHAVKYGFRDLKAAHANMRDMSELAKSVKQATAKDIAKRNDPVSVSPGATGARPDPSHFSSAVEYMRSLKS